MVQVSGVYHGWSFCPVSSFQVILRSPGRKQPPHSDHDSNCPLASVGRHCWSLDFVSYSLQSPAAKVGAILSFCRHENYGLEGNQNQTKLDQPALCQTLLLFGHCHLWLLVIPWTAVCQASKLLSCKARIQGQVVRPQRLCGFFLFLICTWRVAKMAKTLSLPPFRMTPKS